MTAQELIAKKPETRAFGLLAWSDMAVDMLRKQAEQIEALKADAERYKWLTVNAYVGVAQYPKPHEVWCLRLPNPQDCNNLDEAIGAMKGKS